MVITNIYLNIYTVIIIKCLISKLMNGYIGVKLTRKVNYINYILIY